ncbi:MAG TPA: cytochrome c-type biogenesis protein [Nitrolancea sp.]|nr:cytochrome c-type biogenesis protein [Nitrolancea sp.]
MKRSLSTAFAVAVLLLLLPLAAAADEPLSPEALKIANGLNCPVCSGESVRDSQASIAVEMRQVIQQQLDQGQSPDQIKEYFVERYGVSILREPPKQGFYHTLWWMPVAGLAFGAIILALYIMSRPRSLPEPSVDDDELRRLEEQVGQELLADQGM